MIVLMVMIMVINGTAPGTYLVIYTNVLNVLDIVPCKTHKNPDIILIFTLDEGLAAS